MAAREAMAAELEPGTAEAGPGPLETLLECLIEQGRAGDDEHPENRQLPLAPPPTLISDAPWPACAPCPKTSSVAVHRIGGCVHGSESLYVAGCGPLRDQINATSTITSSNGMPTK